MVQYGFVKAINAPINTRTIAPILAVIAKNRPTQKTTRPLKDATGPKVFPNLFVIIALSLGVTHYRAKTNSFLSLPALKPILLRYEI